MIAPSLVAGGGVAVFFSCDRGEYSYPTAVGAESVYTQAFVKALHSLASSRYAVTASRLQSGIEELMRQWRLATGKKQTPKLRPSHADVVIVPGR